METSGLSTNKQDGGGRELLSAPPSIPTARMWQVSVATKLLRHFEDGQASRYNHTFLLSNLLAMSIVILTPVAQTNMTWTATLRVTM